MGGAGGSRGKGRRKRVRAESGLSVEGWIYMCICDLLLSSFSSSGGGGGPLHSSDHSIEPKRYWPTFPIIIIEVG